MQMVTEATSPNLEALLEEYSPYVWRVVRYMGVPASDVPDVCQEVFVVVHRKLREFQGRSHIRTWVYGICLRTVSAYRRKAHRRREVVTSEMDERAGVGLSRSEAKVSLDSLLDRLSEEKRSLVVLYEIEGLSMREVAEILDCPIQTAYSRLRTARRELKELVKDE